MWCVFCMINLISKNTTSNPPQLFYAPTPTLPLFFLTTLFILIIH
jgi:hypothetical protein